MAQFVKHFVQDLTQDIKIRQCGTIVFNGDNLSNVITVDLYNGTEPYSGGGSVSCSVICPDGVTVPITNGSISGNTVSVTLTGDCFVLPGQIGVGVQVVSGDIHTTVLKAIYNVELLETDTIVDPGSRITASVGQLVSDIENAVAQIPASDMASLMAGIAPAFSASTNYTAGAYVYYNGTLYRFTADHTAGSWTGTDATQVALSNDLGSQVSDLKSAVDILDYYDKTFNKSLSAEGYTTVGERVSLQANKTYHVSIDLSSVPSGSFYVYIVPGENSADPIFYQSMAGLSHAEKALTPNADINNYNVVIYAGAAEQNDITVRVYLDGNAISRLTTGLGTANTNISELQTNKANKATVDNIEAELENKAEKSRINDIQFVNLYNGNTHSGILTQSNGTKYGVATANENYFYTDLIEIGDRQRICVFNDFIGSAYVYITFYNNDKNAVGMQNGYNPIITTFPSGAVYIAVCCGIAFVDTLSISEAVPIDYLPSNGYVSTAINKASVEHKRLDRGYVNAFPISTDAGKALYKMTVTTGAVTTYPINLDGVESVSYRKRFNTPNVVYIGDDGKIISNEELVNETGTLNIPSSALFCVIYVSTNAGFDPETDMTFVSGNVPPETYYGYDDVEIDGLIVSDSDYLKGKAIVFDGDSITEGAGVTDVTTGIAPNNNKGWGYWVQQNHPASKCYGYGKSGWKVGKRDGYDDSLLNHIASYPASVDLFVLSGGYNDQAVQMAMGELVEVTDGANAYYNATFDQYTFCGALEYWFQQLRTNYPTAQIVYVLTPKRIYTTNPVFNNDTKGELVRDVLYSTGYERMNKFWEAIKAACDKWAIRYIDLSDVSGIVGTGEITDTGLTVNSRYFQITDGVPDMTHPNTLYYKTFIVPQIEALIKAVLS